MVIARGRFSLSVGGFFSLTFSLVRVAWLEVVILEMNSGYGVLFSL